MADSPLVLLKPWAATCPSGWRRREAGRASLHLQTTGISCVCVEGEVGKEGRRGGAGVVGLAFQETASIHKECGFTNPGHPPGWPAFLFWGYLAGGGAFPSSLSSQRGREV